VCRFEEATAPAYYPKSAIGSNLAASPAFGANTAPQTCIGAGKDVTTGAASSDHISTSYAERQNLTMRVSMRRFTRSTNGFSKQLANHEHALALYCVLHLLPDSSDVASNASNAGGCHRSRLGFGGNYRFARHEPQIICLAMPVLARTIILLAVANVFMTFAWYAHLRNLHDKKWYIAALISWGLALFEYIFQVPANRIGFTQYNLGQLKILQEVITLLVFAPFAVLYMRQPLTLNFLWAGLCMVGAVYFMFR
jgi:hypothetical protein